MKMKFSKEKMKCELLLPCIKNKQATDILLKSFELSCGKYGWATELDNTVVEFKDGDSVVEVKGFEIVKNWCIPLEESKMQTKARTVKQMMADSNGDFVTAIRLCKTGYRKATDVIDEFMEKITCRLSYDRDSELYGKTEIVLMLNKIADEMRKEMKNDSV